MVTFPVPYIKFTIWEARWREEAASRITVNFVLKIHRTLQCKSDETKPKKIQFRGVTGRPHVFHLKTRITISTSKGNHG